METFFGWRGRGDTILIESILAAPGGVFEAYGTQYYRKAILANGK